MTDLDITPFGFTPTESRAYNALLNEGPSSGYALAKKLSIARANAYQALNGLVKKSAAITTDERPERYRAIRPDALLALLIDSEARKLDTLEEQIHGTPEQVGEALVHISGRRALVDLALRTAAREPGPVTCVGPGDVLQSLAPAWRKRTSDDVQSRLWTVGPSPPLPVQVSGEVDPALSARFFAGSVFLLATSRAVIVAGVSGEGAEGYWSSDAVFVGLATATVEALTAPQAR